MAIRMEVDGLAELRRGTVTIVREVSEELEEAIESGAEIAARQAALLAPRQTGRLAASYRAFARGKIAGVRSPLPYAGVHEYGGTIRPRGVAIEIQRALPVTRALEREENAIVDAIGDGIDDAASRTGWH